MAELPEIFVEALREALGGANRRYYTQHDSPLGRRKHIDRIRQGKLQGWKEGRCFYALRDDVHKYIESHPVRPKAPESEADDVARLLNETETN